MLEGIISFLLLIPILLLYGLAILAIIGSFMWPVMHWNESKNKRKEKNKSISKSDYVQEFILTVATPFILMAMGVLYLIERI